MASCIRMIQSGIRLSKSRCITSASTMNGVTAPAISYCTFSSNSPNGKPIYVDTLALIRRLEAQGIHPKQAEAVTSQMTQLLNVSMEYILENVVSKAEMQRVVMATDTNLLKLKSEVQSCQDNNSSSLKLEDEKLRNEIDKLRSELRHEIEKVTSAQRLDLNLERRRIEEELSDMRAKTTDLYNKHHNVEMANETNIMKLKSEVQISLDEKFSPLQSKCEGLRNDIEKLRGELKNEVLKITGGQRLDLNLEKRRVDEKLGDVRAESTKLCKDLEPKLETESRKLKEELAAHKLDTVKYFSGFIFSQLALIMGLLIREYFTK